MTAQNNGRRGRVNHREVRQQCRQILEAEWKILPADEKEKYELLAQRDHQRYVRAAAAYRAHLEEVGRPTIVGDDGLFYIEVQDFRSTDHESSSAEDDY